MRKCYSAALMFLLGLPVWAGSTSVISVDTTDSSSIGGYSVDSTDVLAVAWTQTVGITGDVSVNFQTGFFDTSGTLYAYLTDSIGSGTTQLGNEIANTTFASPDPLDGPVWINVFGGIQLNPGFYYLTIGSLDSTSGGWSATSDPTVTVTPGFFLGDLVTGSQFWASGSDVAAYLPASNFSPQPTVADGGGPDLMFDVSVPEPSTIWLLGGALWFALLRRKRSA
jgi:hypothetical protein